MPIYRLLQNQPFEPEDVERLTAAYEQTLKALSLIDRTDPITERVAKIVIEIGQTGVKDPDRIAIMAIKELGA